MEPTVHISSCVDSCGRGFLSLADVLRDSYYASQVRPESVIDEFDRFKLWAGNIAAHRKGQRSLEYRLRDAAHLKEETLNLLGALQDSVRDARAIVTKEKIPWDEDAPSDGESDTDSDQASEIGSSELQGDTELKQIFASIKNSVTCLFRLSMAIRDPAPNTQSQSTITIDKSFFEQHDIMHVSAKYPGRKDYLIERLGRAISGRRQYLSYREEHHHKLSKNVERIGFEEPRTEHTTNSTEATRTLKQPQTMIDEDDALSQTSFATSVNTTIRVPPLPKEARNELFECPFCFMIVSIQTTAAWKQHVYRDLHPYCCTFESCTTADRLYDSRHAWFKHELEAHRTSWQCIEGCGKVFSTIGQFRGHVHASHPDLASADMLSVLTRTASKGANLLDQAACPLCDKKMALRMLQKHLGHHQEQLALFALPPNLEQTEDDAELEEVGSDVAEGIQDEELSDLSDTEFKQNSIVEPPIITTEEDFDYNPSTSAGSQNEELEALQMPQAQGGVPLSVQRLGGVVGAPRIHKSRVHESGAYFEYQLIDENGNLLNNGAWFHDPTLQHEAEPNPDSGYHELEDRPGKSHVSDQVSTAETLPVDGDGAQVNSEQTDEYRGIRGEHEKLLEKLQQMLKGAILQKDEELHIRLANQHRDMTEKLKRLIAAQEDLKKETGDNEAKPLSNFNENPAKERKRIVHEYERKKISDSVPDGPDAEQERERRLAEYELELKSEEAESKKERERIITEFENKRSSESAPDGAQAKREREQLLTQLKLEEKLKKQQEEEDYRTFLRSQKESQQEEEYYEAFPDSQKERQQDSRTRNNGSAKRKGPASSCEECRMRKINCNREEPCGACIHFNSPTCTYRAQTRADSSSAAVSAEEVAGRPNIEYEVSERDQAIANMQSMGFPRVDIDRAIRAAHSNLDRAVEYLINGIPASALEGQWKNEPRMKVVRDERGSWGFSSEAKAGEERRDEESEDGIREHLQPAEFSLQESQIENMSNPEAQAARPQAQRSSSFGSKPRPTYVKVHKQHLSIETLTYYDIPYEIDSTDPNYYIILREMDAKETEILFEHTRRLRQRQTSRVIIDERRRSLNEPDNAFDERRRPPVPNVEIYKDDLTGVGRRKIPVSNVKIYNENLSGVRRRHPPPPSVDDDDMAFYSRDLTGEPVEDDWYLAGSDFRAEQ